MSDKGDKSSTSSNSPTKTRSAASSARSSPNTRNGPNNTKNSPNISKSVPSTSRNSPNTSKNGQSVSRTGLNTSRSVSNSSSASYSQQKEETFVFEEPPEAIVLRPTREEFEDPLAFIATIRPRAEIYGICKIIPPEDWTPPFAVDVDKLTFTPRVQRLNELEAITRVNFNFLDQIAKFWDLQGSLFRFPMVENRPLDLYNLHRVVQQLGGFENVIKERKWKEVADSMGFQKKGVGAALKMHYERLLYPYDLFKSGKTFEGKLDESIPSTSKDTPVDKTDKDYKPHGIASRMQIKPSPEINPRRSKRFDTDESDLNVKTKEEKVEEDEAAVKELRRLKFYGAGPKMAGYEDGQEVKPRSKSHVVDEPDPLARYICRNCNGGDDEEYMLLCDGCDDSYHTFCLMPPLLEIPAGDWRCPKCVAEEVSKPMEAFGFEQAKREYTLQQFGDMADQFKSDYFNMPVHKVPLETVEREFWRIVSTIDEDVTVEYGADLHTMDHGSGFPTNKSENLSEMEKKYAESGWNLNNLPVLEGSVLGHINADISGMKVPWMYVGMCFSTFCWHNEDHWSYSINYLHWGEAKTWYGVPGTQAEEFEETMKSVAPELFQAQPDLLHQLVTIMNPNILMKNGIQVFKMNQYAGEFIVTFPRAYHAGFNQGYNFAEAVNFAPADWLSIGRECVLHYSNLRRYCVFSHDEVVCKMSLISSQLDYTLAAATYNDMLVMLDMEKNLRKAVLDSGVTNAEREAFELLHDDERQCEICKTTCFLSAMTCSCSAEKLVCLRHFQNHCECSPEKRTLRYRYTLEELPRMMQNLKVIAESFEAWVANVNEVLDPNLPKRTLTFCRELLHEATVKKFPKSELIQKFSAALELAEKYANGVEQLDPNKMRTRHSNDAKITLTFNQLVEFSSELEDVFCHVDETNCVRDLLHEAQIFEKDSNRLLNLPLAECLITDLEVCHTLGSGLRSLELPNVRLLASRIKHCQWYQSLLSYKEKEDLYTIEWLKHFLNTGNKLDPHHECYKEMINLQEILQASETWEDKAEQLFKCTDNDLLIQVDQLLKERATIKCFLPNEAPLKESLDKARDWLKIFEDMKSSEYSPYFEEVDRLVKRGRSLALQLVEVDRLNVILDRAKRWKEETSNLFLKTNSTITLLEALMPREISNEIESPPKNKLLSLCKAATRFKESENRELDFIRNVKAANGLKSLDPKDNSNFCICKKKVSGIMMQCDLCKDWFHSNCVQLPKVASTKFTGKFNTAALHMGFKDCKFLCSTCVRTKRPLLMELKDLLVRIDELPVIMREGAALQWLSERALQLQERAKQLLLHPEVESAKNELEILIKKYTEAAETESAKKEATRQRNSRERASRKPDLTSKAQDTYEKVGSYSGTTDSDDATRDSSEYDSDRMGEHAYSLNLPKVDSDDYRLILSPEIKERLQDILMEADLLEVSLNETFDLWTILQASRDPYREPIYIDFDKKKDKPKEPLIAVRKSMRPKKKRRRLSEEMDLPKKLSKTVKVEPEKKQQEVDTTKKPSKNGKLEADKKQQEIVTTKKVCKGLKLEAEKKQQEVDTSKKVIKSLKTDLEAKMRLRRLKRAKVAGRKRKGKKRGRKPKVSSTASPSTESEDEDDDDDEDDICAANGCQKPAEEKKIDWVQCDGGCDKWFHMVCVGLSAGDIQEDEDYICITCSKHTTYETMDSSSCSPKPSTSKDIS
ncbi:unnamed protein product [Diabrotica balteata]|uniref:[histone H3]-trimethyl-L-lysine(4) demethylase n=1 Tax=Diabrotica balteata TaxID=107213 RepID=A0A9N9SQE0_DIABA|nr:unnamed protein product [Diabrotica balteata]